MVKKHNPKRDQYPYPYYDYPLTANGNGQWSKRINGRTYYFGPLDDPQGALEKYQKQKDDLYLGLPVRGKGGTKLSALLSAFRTSKRNAHDLGELSARSLAEYEATCDLIAKAIPDSRPVETLATADFVRLRDALCKGKGNKKRGPVSAKRYIGMARMVFNFANEEFEPPLSHPVRYRKALRLPPAKEIRKARNAVGERMFSPDEINALLDNAKPQLKAMIYLGINCGYGNGDCAQLPIEAVVLKKGWIEFPRPKTEINRRCHLWDETAAALYAVIKNRTDGLVFVTKYGNAWAGKGRADPISYEFRKLVKTAKIRRKKGVTTFYSLRRTFETIGQATGDAVAVDYIMGHTPAAQDMAAVYRQRTFDKQLRKVTDHVHDWLTGAVVLS